MLHLPSCIYFPLFLVCKINVTFTVFAPYLVLFTPRCLRFCDIFARSKFVQINFFVQCMYSAIPPNIDSIKRALSPLHSIQYCCFLSTGPGCGALLTRDIVNRTIQTTTAFNSSVDENYAILNSSSAWCSSDLDTFQYLTVNIGTGNLARPTCVSIFWGV